MPADRTSAPVAERRHDERIEALPRAAERAQIAVIVVIVAEQDHGDRRQIVEPHRRLPDPARTEQVSGPARSEYIGSVRMFPAAVWIRNVEWPMKVTTAAASSSGGGRCGGASTCAGHGVRGSSSIRGTAENGCGGAGGIEESLAVEVIARRSRHRWISPGDHCPPPGEQPGSHSTIRGLASPWCNSGCIPRAMHPRRRRCSSLKYAEYSRSSRLAGVAPRPSRCDAGIAPRTASCYSRSRTVGSALNVRRAGTRHAAIATPAITPVTARKVPGSVGETS